MRTRAILALLFLLCTLLGRVFPGETAPKDEPVVISDGQRLPSPLHICAGVACHRIGEPRSSGLEIVNHHEKLVVRIPLNPLITGEPLVSIKVTNEDGAEAVTYLEGGVPPFDLGDDAPDYPPVLMIQPGGQLWMIGPAFVLWEPGEYTYRMELRNDLTKQRVMIVPKGFIAPRATDVPIPNVWVGRIVFEGTVPLEEGPSEELKKTLERLEAEALDSRRLLPKRTTALNSLVEMRHVYATDTLIAIEQKVRPAREKVFHVLVVKALYDIAYYGTGYRALRVFADIVLDHDVTPLARLLSLEVLLTFERNKDLRHKGRIFHVVGAGEREIAEKALRKVRARIAELPAELVPALTALPAW